MADISVSEISLIIYLCSPVKTSAVHNFTCLYGPTENVQNEATILTVRRKYLIRLEVPSSTCNETRLF